MTGGWDPLLRDAAAGRKREGESKWRRACVCCCFSLQRLLGTIIVHDEAWFPSCWLCG